MMSASALVERASELGGRIALAVAVTIGFVLLGRLLAPLVRRLLDRRRRPSYTRVFVGLFRMAVVLVGVLASLTLAFPSVRVADVLAIFGIVSVAAGFAFKDTFENLLAGVLLMLRDPFKSGDQVTVAGTTGTDPVLTCRFWAGSTRAASTAARDAAITAVLARLVADDVPTTPEHRVIIATDAEAVSPDLNDHPSANLQGTGND